MFENRIKTMRKSRGYTQKELAKMLNCAPSKVAMWETGDRTPRTDDLIKLSEMFDVTVGCLAGVEDIDIEKICSYDLKLNKDTDTSDFSKRLKVLRVNGNKCQEEIASMLGVSTRAYGYYEQGEREPNLISVLKLADYFNVSTDYLLGRSNTKIIESSDEKDLEVALENVLNRKDLVLENVSVSSFEINRLKSIFSNLLELIRENIKKD